MGGHNNSDLLEFGGVRLDIVRRQLTREGGTLPLTAKAFDTLLLLIRYRGVTVSKTDLMNEVWADTAVEENNLTQQISTLRRTLGERPDDHRFIVTVPGRGYKFVAEVNDVYVGQSGALQQSPSDPGSLLPQPGLVIDSGTLTGYTWALTYILLIGFCFLYSAISNVGSNRPQSLAVLSFRADASSDEFIGAGISDTLRARLGSVRDLVVRHPTELPIDQDVIAAGRRLQVDTIVTGSVQRDHERIRVAIELLDVADGRIVWSKTFDDTASNLFELQDSIAGEVARVLNVRFVSRKPQTTLLPLWEFMAA